jgi:nickel-dependent lactate racemase
MIVKLPFGRDTVAVDLRGLKVRPLQSTAPQGVRDVGRLISRAVDFPKGCPSLSQLATGCSTIVVIVPDSTRRIELPEVLPVIFDRLLAAGATASSITVLVACGTHPQVASEEIERLVGSLPHGVRVRQHDSRSAEGLSLAGMLREELPIHLDREAMEADLLVTVGGVRHHYFAGFGGGPKMIFPGIAGHDEIQANHSLVLCSEGSGVVRHPDCEPGVLVGNPVAEEIARAADLRPPDLALCLVPGRSGGIAWAVAGPWRTAFDLAVAKVREWFELPDVGFDHLVGCGGGPPADATLIQAHKGLDAICRFANPGAEVIFVAGLEYGTGSAAMEPFLEDPRPSSILERLGREYVQYGHTTLRIVEKTSRYRIFLLSGLPDDLARRLGFIPVHRLEEITERWRATGFRDRVAVMPESTVWPRLRTGS